MKALVTGSGGFVGSHLVQHLLAHGDQVLTCSRPDVPAAGAPENIPSKSHLVWDLGQPAPQDVVDRVAAFQPQVVYHLAAISRPSACGAHGKPNSQADRVNRLGTQHVIDLAGLAGRRIRLLLASSSYVYARSCRQLPRVREDAPVAPETAYGKTKHQAEQLVLEATRRQQIEGLVARAFNHTGPGQTIGFMLPDWISQLAAGTETLQLVTLDATLDLSDVRDVVAAYRSLAVRAEAGSIYNVGSGVARRSGEILQQLLKVAKAEPRIVETHPGPRRNPIADIDRIHRDIGWQPEIALATTLRDAWLHASSRSR